MKEELKFAALYGPEIIPYYRRKVKSRSKEIMHRDVEYLLKRVKYEQIEFDGVDNKTVYKKIAELFIQQKNSGIYTDCLIVPPHIMATIFYVRAACFVKRLVKAPKMELRVAHISDIDSNDILSFYIDPDIPKDTILLTQESLSKGIAIKIV